MIPSIARAARAGALLAALTASGAASAGTLPAIDSYYVFRGVSANTERLLADKAPVIGFPDIPSISFLLFDELALPAKPLRPRGLRARLTLTHDPDTLAGTLIPATDSRPVAISAYAIDGAWAPEVGGPGNKDDIVYGDTGSAAIATTPIGVPGRYDWDITSLVDAWIDDARPPVVALSGVFGNVDLDGRNSYATFYADGAAPDLAPAIVIAPIPLPAGLWLLAAALAGLIRLRAANAGGRAAALRH